MRPSARALPAGGLFSSDEIEKRQVSGTLGIAAEIENLVKTRNLSKSP